MTEPVASVWGWVVPALVVFSLTAIAIVVLLWALRRARRSPKAQAAAEAQRVRAGSLLVRLDDAVDELDLEVALSGALYDGTAPPSLRRARMTAQHVRDESFREFSRVTDAAETERLAHTSPDELRRASARISSRVGSALAAIDRARAEHAAWIQSHVTAGQQVAAARRRRDDVRAQVGDPAALVRALAARFDESEYRPAAAAAETITAALAEADRLLDDAQERADDPTRSALPMLAGAERFIRHAHSAARTLDENYRLVTDAALAAPNELASLRDAVREAIVAREGLEPADGERLAREIRAVEAGLAEADATAIARPTATIDAVVRLRDRLDLALGDARSAQQRLRGARTALPGTLASARAAIARAESATVRAGADARSRLDSAQRELAGARQADDPVAALDAGRRALRHAEDAVALADYERQASSGRGL